MRCCRAISRAVVSWVDEGMGPWPRSRGPGCPRRLREAQHGEQVVWRPRPRPRWRKRRKVCHRNPRCGGPAAGWTRGQSAPTANPSLRLSAELRSSDQSACACIACVGLPGATSPPPHRDPRCDSFPHHITGHSYAQRCGTRCRVGGRTNVRLCASRCKDKKSQNVSEIEQKSPVLTRTLSASSFPARGPQPPGNKKFGSIHAGCTHAGP